MSNDRIIYDLNNARWRAGLFGENADGVCYIYENGFPAIELYAHVNEDGAQVEDDQDVQDKANKIAQLLNDNL